MAGEYVVSISRTIYRLRTHTTAWLGFILPLARFPSLAGYYIGLTMWCSVFNGLIHINSEYQVINKCQSLPVYTERAGCIFKPVQSNY